MAVTAPMIHTATLEELVRETGHLVAREGLQPHEAAEVVLRHHAPDAEAADRLILTGLRSLVGTDMHHDRGRLMRGGLVRSASSLTADALPPLELLLEAADGSIKPVREFTRADVLAFVEVSAQQQQAWTARRELGESWAGLLAKHRAERTADLPDAVKVKLAEQIKAVWS